MQSWFPLRILHVVKMSSKIPVLPTKSKSAVWNVHDFWWLNFQSWLFQFSEVGNTFNIKQIFILTMFTFVQIGFLGTFLDISNFLRTSTLQCNKVVQFLMITLKGPISRWIYCTTSSNPTFSKIDGAFSTLVLNTRVAMGAKKTYF